MKPDDICREYYESGVQLKVQELNSDYILIEGTKDALVFLSKLIKACSESESTDNGFHLGPTGAGCAWFCTGSTKGFYIRCCPGSSSTRDYPQDEKSSG